MNWWIGFALIYVLFFVYFFCLFFSETHIRRVEISIKYLRIKSRRISLVNYIFMYLKMQHAFASRTCFSLNVYALYVFNSNFIGANALETVAGFFCAVDFGRSFVVFTINSFSWALYLCSQERKITQKITHRTGLHPFVEWFAIFHAAVKKGSVNVRRCSTKVL